MAEIAVHFSIATLPSDYIMLTINCPNSIKVIEINLSQLPKYWNSFPALKKTQVIGDTLVNEGKSAICKVPSVVTKGDFNFLLNPNHRDFKMIKIIKREKFTFDKRLFK